MNIEQYHKIHDVRWTRTANDNNNTSFVYRIHKDTFLFVLRRICRDIVAFSSKFMRVLKIECQSILQVMFITALCLRKKRSIQWQRMEISAKRNSQNDEIARRVWIQYSFLLSGYIGVTVLWRLIIPHRKCCLFSLALYLYCLLCLLSSLLASLSFFFDQALIFPGRPWLWNSLNW